MGVVYHRDLIQGDEPWLAARRGVLCASEVCKILTPTLKIASNDKERSHVFELAAQRVTDYTEPHFVGYEMERGHVDEVEAAILYNQHYAPVETVGFVTNDKLGFVLGYSPDGLIGDDGLIEVKSRRQRFQIETIINQEMPDDYALQVQTGLLVTERKWLDFLSYSGGMYMATIRVFPDPKIQDAIIEAATAFEARVRAKVSEYEAVTKNPKARLIMTERKIEQEMFA